MQPPVVTEMSPMVPSAASVAPVAPNPGAAPMEAMSGVQNQEEGQAVPPYKYDLLNSLPCEWSSTYAVLRRALCTMALLWQSGTSAVVPCMLSKKVFIVIPLP